VDISEKDGLRLTTGRLRLRSLRQADLPELLAIGGQVRVAQMFHSVPHPWTAAHCAGWIAQAAWTGAIPFRVGVLLPDGRLIGTVGVVGPPVSIGYFIDAGHTGQGYAAEAAHAVLDFLFRHFAPDFVQAEHFDDNPASGAVLRRLGFEKSGSGLSQSPARLEPAPNTLYRLKRADLLVPQRKA
jgi:RimJ/RimL family protein N-acetyltransferase